MKKLKVFFLCSMMVTSTIYSQTLNDAIKLTTNEQFEKADAAFKSLILSQPNNGEYYFYYGENFFKNDNLEMANAQYQKGADANATNPLPYVGLGKVQWYQNKQTEAKANFYKATTLGAGKNATVLVKIAEAYINADTKNLPEAFNLLTQAAKLDPKNAEIYIQTGDAFLEQNDGSKAIENYEKAVSLDKTSVRAILREGKLYSRAKNYNLALDYYKKANDIDSTFAPAFREKAEMYLRAGQYTNAAKNAKRYLDLNNDCSARSRYAGMANQAKLYKESIEAAVEALKCDPNNAYTYRYKGRSEFEVGDFVNGLQTFSTFFDMASKNPELKLIPEDYEYRGKLEAKSSKDSLAIIDFLKVIELQPEKVDLYGDIANSDIKMKKYPEAIEAFKKKLEKGKFGANDYFGIGRAYYYGKDYINADSSFAQIIKMQPDLSLGYLWRAKTNAQLDPKNEKWLAKPYYEIYLTKLKPEDMALPQNKSSIIEAYTYLGVYGINTKDMCGAKVWFKKIQELDPANANAKKFLESAEAKKCP